MSEAAPDRPLAEIDHELALTVNRRARSRSEISRLSQGVVNDTRRIDALLAQRSAALLTTPPDDLAGFDEQLNPRPAPSP